MQSLLFYILKVILCSGIFYLYYLAVLRNKKFHPYNRFYLLFTAILSCGLPLLHISMFDINSNNEKMLKLMQLMYGGTLPDVTIETNNRFSIDWPHAVLIASLAVTLFLSVLIIVRIIKIYRLKKSFPSTHIEEIDFVNTDIQSAPFSFFKNMFWRNDIDLNEETGMQIFRHEMAHIEQKHSSDKLFFQILRAVFWMNPVFYFMNRELLLIHEFIADEKAVQSGDGESFARMLLMTQIGKFAFEPAHPFFYSTIKKRLNMITDSQKTTFSYLRRITVLPLLGIVSFAFAFRAHRIETKKTEAVLDKMIADIDIEKKNDSFRLLQNKTYLSLKPTIPDTLYRKALYVVNGMPLHQNEVSAIKPDNIESITVLKEKSAESLYGDKGKNGVILITTKAGHKNNMSDSLKKKSTVRIFGNGQPLYIINGKVAKEYGYQLLNTDPSSIRTIEILKDNAAISAYGLQARNGVIKITTKDAKYKFEPLDSSMKRMNRTITFVSKNNNDPIIVKGRPNPEKVQTIRLSEIVKNENKSDVPKDTLPEVTVVGYGTNNKNFDGEFITVQNEPEYPGGADAWARYLKMNLRQDVPEKNHAPAGEYPVIVSFLVDKNGDVSEVRIVKAPHPDYGTAAEAARVIYRSGKWKPAIQNGRDVSYRQKQRIVFDVIKDDDSKKQ